MEIILKVSWKFQMISEDLGKNFEYLTVNYFVMFRQFSWSPAQFARSELLHELLVIGTQFITSGTSLDLD